MARSDTESEAFSEADGPLVVGATRNVISTFLQTGKKVTPSSLAEDLRFRQKMGCFVTLKKNDPEKSLRGCIGYPEPVYELSKALMNSAVEAATGDPRFPPVRSPELARLLLEVSLLTKPVEMMAKNQKDLLSKIEIGKDGLIMRWSFGSGLLLPQVATEYNWGPEEFLCNLSMKAGAPPDQWLIPGTLVYKFNALIFEETSPGAAVKMH
jgi:uncharacterized protein